MKKFFTLSYFAFLISYCSFAQSVGVGTNTPNASAQLDVTASNKGILIPRMNTTAIATIANPAKGLMVLDTAKNQLVFNIGTPSVPNWQTIAFNSGWNTTGNAATNAAINFIGTTDATDLIFKRNSEFAGWIGASNTSLGILTLNPVSSTASFNTAMGGQSLFYNTTGGFNTAFGFSALTYDSSGAFNTASGAGALFNNTGGNSNTASGYQSLFSNKTGSDNTALGIQSLYTNQAGYSNVAIGGHALYKNFDRSNLVAIGDSALYNNGEGATQSFEGIRNTAVGSKSLYSNTKGLLNTAVGFHALRNNTTGDGNTAIGNNALLKNTEGDDNIAIGGDSTLTENLSGIYNAAIGSAALHFNFAGSLNTAIGHRALYAASGTGNTALGYNAGGFGSGDNNVFIGREAGNSEAGSNRLYISNSSNDAANTLVYGEFDNKILSVGGRLGIGNTRPHADLHLPQTLANRKIVLLEDFDNDHQFNGFGINTFIMRYQAAATTSSHVFYAGTSPTTSNELMRITGNGEVGIGKIPLISNNDSRLQIKQKGIQNGIGIEAPNSTNHWDCYVTTDVESNLVLYYNGSNKGAFDNVTGAYTANSDRRLKKDITLQAPVMNNLMQLQAYQYHYLDNHPTDRFSNGFMAQDVQKIFPDAVVENELKNGEKRLGINYQYFTVLAIKGLQEQQQQIQSQEERIAKLEALVKTLTGGK